MHEHKIIPFNPLKIKIAQSIHQQLDHLAESLNKKKITFSEVYFLIGPCAKPELGEFCFPSFFVAKLWQLNPAIVSNSLQDNLHTDQDELFDNVKAAGPYLNFTLNGNATLDLFLQHIHRHDFFKTKFYSKTEKVMIEFSQPNTHKEMHVGHMRNVCLGAAIANLYRYTGEVVTTSTYPGDSGAHVAKCLWYFKKNNLTPPTNRKGAWLGSIYTKAHLQLEDELGSPKEEQNRIELANILKELHSQKGEFFELWKVTRQWSLDLMKEVYDWLDVSFDHWFFESEVDEASIKLVKEYFEKGIFVKDDGAIGIDLSSDNLGFCLLLKRDGNGLYATKDLELAKLKFRKFHIEKNIYVVDERQSLHFKQVFKTLEKMGFEHAKNSKHLAYEMVELVDGPMSSRKGNIIAIQTLIDQMEQTIKDQYLNKYLEQWPLSEIQTTATKIANAAIKYGMLKIDPAKKIIFDLSEWLKVDGNSGPYLLYTYARVGSILGKANYDANQTVIWQFLENAEKDLLSKMWLFNDAVLDAKEKNSPSILCNYLYELCQQLNTFYAQCSIMNAKTSESKQTRLTLLHSFQMILKQGLMLLNIAVVDRM